MTDLADAGSVAARAQPAGNLATPPADGDNGSAPPAGKSWFDGLSEGNRKLAEAKGWTKAENLDRVFTSYAELERQGVFFVVVKAECRYRAPARYDEELQLTTEVQRQTHVRIDHSYVLKRGDDLLAEATTTIACVGRDGRVTQIPQFLAGS